ncbi:hypothetical protein B4U80_11666 [Leptotrombidium deliense]|uniref:CUB domain-containing protein n=1 Tax=Leptotrombidium deliense TaxID=299467 RepID=A0A443S3X9_9ACAR|nr:hypothetical protein B4U80_11666 [Leptotrombidium deliense]
MTNNLHPQLIREFESNISSVRKALDKSIANLSSHLNGKFDASKDDIINDLQNIELRLYAYENASGMLRSKLESAMNAIIGKQKQLEAKQNELSNVYKTLRNNSEHDMNKIGEYLTELNSKLTKLQLDLNEEKQIRRNSSEQQQQHRRQKSDQQNSSSNSSLVNQIAEVNYLTNVTEFILTALYSRFTCKNEVIAGSTKVSLNIEYKPNSDCLYVIRSKEKRIQYWTDEFETEACCDYLRVIDGNDVYDFRGDDKRLTRKHVSKSTVVYLYFHSDQSVEKSPILLKLNEV